MSEFRQAAYFRRADKEDKEIRLGHKLPGSYKKNFANVSVNVD